MAVAVGVPYGKFANVIEADVTTDDGRVFHPAAQPLGGFSADIGGAPVGELTIKITRVIGAPGAIGCINQIALDHGPDERKPLYQLFTGDPAALVALEDDVAALQQAFESCNASALSQLVEFPLHRLAPDHKGPGAMLVAAPIADATALAALCRAHEYSLGKTPDDAIEKVTFKGPDAVSISPSVIFFDFVWSGGHWRLRSVTEV